MPALPAILVDALTYTYPAWAADQPPNVIWRDVSFGVTEGQCLALMGGAGCGKSTLCEAVAGLSPRLTGGRLEGSILVAGRDPQAEPIGAMADCAGIVLDDPAGQIFNPTVADEIGWGLENLGVPPAEMPARVARALALVGLESVALEQPPEQLSGGQQKRLALAAALALDPRVLILDQPSGGLSPLGKAELIDALRALRQSARLTILLAESDPAFVTALADAALILHGGGVAFHGGLLDAYEAAANHPEWGIALPPAFLFSRSAGAAPALALSDLLPHVKPPAANKGDVARASVSGPVTSEIAVELQDVSFHYVGGADAVHGVTLAIRRGEFAALVGENGAGKTTLIKHLIGLLRPAAGSVRLNGEDIAARSIGQLARQVGLIFQNPESQLFSATVRDEVAFGPRNLGLAGADLDRAVHAALAEFELEAVEGFPPAILSLSGRRRVAFASVAAMSASILALDEPTAGLDEASSALLARWLARRHREGETILLITHDMEMVARLAQRVVVMRSGRIVADGAPQEVFSQTETLREAGLEAPFAVQLARRANWPALAADLTPEGAARAWQDARR